MLNTIILVTHREKKKTNNNKYVLRNIGITKMSEKLRTIKGGVRLLARYKKG